MDTQGSFTSFEGIRYCRLEALHLTWKPLNRQVVTVEEIVSRNYSNASAPIDKNGKVVDAIETIQNGVNILRVWKVCSCTSKALHSVSQLLALIRWYTRFLLDCLNQSLHLKKRYASLQEESICTRIRTRTSNSISYTGLLAHRIEQHKTCHKGKPVIRIRCPLRPRCNWI